MANSKSLPIKLRQVTKQLQFGKAIYHLYYQPKGFLERCARKGAINMAIDSYAQRQMEQATYHLPTRALTSTTPLDLHFLTGKKFWYQTSFCAYSMAQHTTLPLRPIIYDDGSLETAYQKEICRIFPNAQIISKLEIVERINTHLPETQFPYLRERRQNYPNLRKVTDIHAGSEGWKLVLDSDMLFFQTPNFLLDWLQSPQQPCHMVDTETSYGYPIPLMESLANAPIQERLNVGICGLKSDAIDWEQLEYWCKTLIEQQGTHYYQEQALVAMLMAGQDCAIAPAEDYIVMPTQAEVIQPEAVLHHYVANSKSWYFRYGWKQAVHHVAVM